MEPRVALEREARGFEADPAREQLRERLVEIPFRLDEVHAVDSAGALGITVVGEEPNAIRLDEERRIRALQPGEVTHVGRIGDEQRLLEPGAKALDAVVHEPWTRNASASR